MYIGLSTRHVGFEAGRPISDGMNSVRMLNISVSQMVSADVSF